MEGLIEGMVMYTPENGLDAALHAFRDRVLSGEVEDSVLEDLVKTTANSTVFWRLFVKDLKKTRPSDEVAQLLAGIDTGSGRTGYQKLAKSTKDSCSAYVHEIKFSLARNTSDNHHDQPTPTVPRPAMGPQEDAPLPRLTPSSARRRTQYKPTGTPRQNRKPVEKSRPSHSMGGVPIPTASNLNLAASGIPQLAANIEHHQTYINPRSSYSAFGQGRRQGPVETAELVDLPHQAQRRFPGPIPSNIREPFATPVAGANPAPNSQQFGGWRESQQHPQQIGAVESPRFGYDGTSAASTPYYPATSTAPSPATILSESASCAPSPSVYGTPPQGPVGLPDPASLEDSTHGRYDSGVTHTEPTWESTASGSGFDEGLTDFALHHYQAPVDPAAVDLETAHGDLYRDGNGLQLGRDFIEGPSSGWQTTVQDDNPPSYAFDFGNITAPSPVPSPSNQDEPGLELDEADTEETTPTQSQVTSGLDTASLDYFDLTGNVDWAKIGEDLHQYASQVPSGPPLAPGVVIPPMGEGPPVSFDQVTPPLQQAQYPIYPGDGMFQIRPTPLSNLSDPNLPSNNLPATYEVPVPYDPSHDRVVGTHSAFPQASAFNSLDHEYFNGPFGSGAEAGMLPLGWQGAAFGGQVNSGYFPHIHSALVQPRNYVSSAVVAPRLSNLTRPLEPIDVTPAPVPSPQGHLGAAVAGPSQYRPRQFTGGPAQVGHTFPNTYNQRVQHTGVNSSMPHSSTGASMLGGDTSSASGGADDMLGVPLGMLGPVRQAALRRFVNGPGGLRRYDA
ncbi:hypothetical protein DFP72DRAFT_895903 [Ephemerocybe angulata]|uniref:Uncharacterized protein n=1 Tax=Ephemerocybe angulata TaxID=980116 RepID=A0A8H6HZL1_9AGAR|nr:hypothetical protein DFP72DRAFT_895903 [Tulosesus angulatus]